MTEPLTDTDFALVERLQRRRQRVLTASVPLFVFWQASFWLGGATHDGGPVTRLIDWVRLPAPLIWVAALLAILVTGGALLRKPAVRAAVNDELAQQHRRSACEAGFWAAVASMVVLYVLSMITQVGVREALHIVLSVTVAAALFRFLWLQRRADR